MNYSTKKYVVLYTKILQYVVKNCINFSVEYSRILSYNYFRITMYKYMYIDILIQRLYLYSLIRFC